MHFKTALSINASVLHPQKMHFKKAFQNSLLKNTCQIAPSKNVFQNCYHKVAVTEIFFISASINAVKNKTDINKSLIIHD